MDHAWNNPPVRARSGGRRALSGPRWRRGSSAAARGLLPNACLLLMLLLAGGCRNNEGQNQAAPRRDPPEVGVVTIAAHRVELSTELPGRTTAFRMAEVRPQVSGIVLQRLFEEGSEVRAGQQLYKIDPARYQAVYDSAVAAQARSEATLTSAQLTVDRYKKLEIGHDISRQDYDNAVAAQLQAAADVAFTKAAVEAARIDLDYTRLASPIAGRTGRSSVTEGALVTANQPAALVTIQQLDPIYVDLTQSSAQLLRLQRELASGRVGAASNTADVTLTLEDGTEYPDKGVLEFTEVTVDQTTGSVTLRALFPNARRELLPGMFVRARLIESVNEQALLVPQQAVVRNPRGEPTVLVVGADDKVELRTLKTDRAMGDQWLVTEGIKAGDKVIVEGLQKVAPGSAVRVVEVGAGTTTQSNLQPG